MSNPTKNIGPEGPTQPTGSREKRVPSDPDAFQKKLEKAGETDPEQKKKRRQQEEEVEELQDISKEAHKAARTKDMIAPFQLGKKSGVTPALEKGISQAGETPPLGETAGVESDFWDEDDFEVMPPLTKGEPMHPPSQQGVGIDGGIAGVQKSSLSVTKEVAPEEIDVAPLAVAEAKKKEKPSVKDEALATAQAAAAGAQTPVGSITNIIPPPPPASTTPYAHLPPAVMELFERMAGVMTVMTQSGVTETTVSLTAPQFSSSPFYGTEIVIREYSTAPKQFNVEVRTSPEAAALFQANIPYIQSSFRTGNYNFGIHRLETTLRIEDEPVSGEKHDEEEQ